MSSNHSTTLTTIFYPRRKSPFRGWWLFGCLLLPFTSLAQFGIQGNFITGKVIKHEAKFTLPIPALSTGADVNFVWHTYGKKEWQQRRKYPVIGLGCTFVDYGIDSVYGKLFAVYPNLTLPLIKGKNIRWDLRIGDGIGYITREYSRTAPVDTINVAIGAHLNDFIYLTTDVSYSFNQHWTIQAGGQFTHISNGSYRKPNLGINMLGAHLGVSYYPVTSRPAHIATDIKPLSGRWLIQARLTMSQVSAYTSGGPLYPVYIASAYASRRWRSHNKAFAGLDYSYHTDINAFLHNNGLEAGHEAAAAWKSGLFAGNEFLFGRVGIVVQAGAYLKQAYIKRDPVYEKVGGNYYFVLKEQGPIKELSIGVFLKTHQNVAEMGELGLGIGF